MSRQAPIRRKAQAGRYAHQLMIGLAVAGPIVFAPATAAPPPMNGLGPNARVLSDDELGDMRGRYIAPSQMSFFGLSMLTMWQTQDGTVLTTSLEFEVDIVDQNPDPNVEERAFDPNVQLWANWSEALCPGCDDGLNIADSTPDGLKSVNGAVQTTELTGDDNDALNVMRLRIGDYTSASVNVGGTGEQISETTELDFDSGFSVKFEKGANLLGMIVQGPANKGADGQAVQMLGAGDTNQFGQHIHVFGDVNTIQNSLDVFIGLDPQQLVTDIAVENALSTMKGWGF